MTEINDAIRRRRRRRRNEFAPARKQASATAHLLSVLPASTSHVLLQGIVMRRNLCDICAERGVIGHDLHSIHRTVSPPIAAAAATAATISTHLKFQIGATPVGPSVRPQSASIHIQLLLLSPHSLLIRVLAYHAGREGGTTGPPISSYRVTMVSATEFC